jgi:hypothetical protein
LADKNQPRGDGQASSLSNLRVTRHYLDNDYEMVVHDLSRGATGLLRVFSLTPRTGGRPSFQARIDDGSTGRRRAPELDFDIEGVSSAAKSDFKAGRNGYIGHHTDRSPNAEERIFQIEITTPSGKVFEGEVFFNVAFSVEATMSTRAKVTVEAKAIRAKPENT